MFHREQAPVNIMHNALKNIVCKMAAIFSNLESSTLVSAIYLRDDEPAGILH